MHSQKQDWDTAVQEIIDLVKEAIQLADTLRAPADVGATLDHAVHLLAQCLGCG